MSFWTDYRRKKEERAASKYSPDVIRSRLRAVLNRAIDIHNSEGRAAAIAYTDSFWRDAITSLQSFSVEVSTATLAAFEYHWEALLDGEFKHVRRIWEEQ